MSVTIKCNCYTCEEFADKFGDKICKATLHIPSSPTDDPAGYWLRYNKGDGNKFCDPDADNCPCWRCGSGLSIKPENSWYRR